MIDVLRTEVRRSPGLWMFPVVVAAFALLTREALSPVVVWIFPNTLTALRPNLLWLVPLAGGLAAWVATRERRRGTEELLSTTPRPAPFRDLASWAAIAGWCCLAYASACVVFLVLTYLNATWGAPDPGPIVVGLVQVAAFSALGYAAARWLPSRFTPPLLAIALYAVLALLAGADRFGIGSLSPAAGPSLSVWHREVPDPTGPQALVLSGLLGVGLAATALSRVRSFRSLAALVAATLAAVLGTGLLLGASPPTAVQEREAAIPYSPVCEKGEGEIPVCVHPAYEVLLPQTADVVNRVAKPLVGIPGGPVRAEQVSRDPEELRPDGTLAFTLLDFGGVSVRYWGYEVARALTRENPVAPAWRADDTCRKSGDSSATQDVIAAWLIRNADGDVDHGYFGLCRRERAALARFAALTPNERRAWLAENYAELRAGKITPGDLP